MSKSISESAVAKRFVRYTKFYTTSDEESTCSPSTERQFELARELAKELEQIGVSNVRLTDTCYVYGDIPASEGFEDCPSIGFIAHMDTSPDAGGENVNAVEHPDYDGGVLEIGNGLYLSPEVFPHLSTLVGNTIITGDGSTLLGADDKAGIAEIVTLAQKVISENIPHGKICIAFTPDEEVGRGPEHFDIESFGADYAYTADGDAENCIEFENFNAAGAKIEFFGKSVHPGSAKGIMVNAALLATEFAASLPLGQTPADTEGYEGFWHLTDMKGDVTYATLDYIIRDHDFVSYEARKNTLEEITVKMQEKYGAEAVKLTLTEQYRNMKEMILPCMHLVENAEKVIAELGMKPVRKPIRGGTDGARLSFMGLPCPNLGTGGHAFHGPFEHIAVESMETAVELLTGIVKKYSEHK